MSLPSDGEREALNLDEEPLKDWILKAYHEKALDSEEHARLVDAERLLLSPALSSDDNRLNHDAERRNHLTASL